MSRPINLPPPSAIISTFGIEDANAKTLESHVWRVVELLPGSGDDAVVIRQQLAFSAENTAYDIVSCNVPEGGPLADVYTPDGRAITIDAALVDMLRHLRLQSKNRLIWNSVMCVNYSNIAERNGLHCKMRMLYSNASSIIIWLGPDNAQRQAHAAVGAIDTISAWLSECIGTPLSEMRSSASKASSPIFSHRGTLPPPAASPVGASNSIWTALAWFFSNPYFARAQAVHELHSARGGDRLILCGTAATEWPRVRLVAEYVVMSTAFSRLHGFAGTCAWWASSTDELMGRSEDWLQMLYLASNYSFTDPRDFVYDLCGFMNFADTPGGHTGREILVPDYSKTDLDVFRDSVEASFVNFDRPNALLYASGAGEFPTWIPRWDKPKLFRNPFRLGKKVPWQPSGPDAIFTWSLDKTANIVSISGFVVGTVCAATAYNESIFGNGPAQARGTMASAASTLGGILSVLKTMSSNALPLPHATLVAAATTLSFGVDEKCEPADEARLAANFVAYLAGALAGSVYAEYVSPGVEAGDGLAFGKPVWDFEYPTSALFVVDQHPSLQSSRLVGACVADVQEGDVVVVPSRATYPLVLRPCGDGTYVLRGYAFVYGAMRGELAWGREVVELKIR